MKETLRLQRDGERKRMLHWRQRALKAEWLIFCYLLRKVGILN